ATFELAAQNLRLVRHYVIVSGSPTFEAWTTYSSSGAPVSLSNLNALQLIVPAGAIRSLTGLQGDAANVPAASVFTPQEQTGGGGHFAIGSTRRASETSVPWIAIVGARDEFYAALMWSGAWSITADRSGSALSLGVNLGPMTTAVRDSIDGPHVLFGVAAGTL